MTAPFGRRNSTVVNCRVNDTTDAALRFAAEQRGTTVAELIRTYLHTGLALDGVDVQRTAAVEGA